MKPAAILLAMTTFLIGTKVYADQVDNWCAEYINGNRQALHKIVIHRDKQDVKIHAYASGFPDDIDWGEVVAEVYPSTGPVQFVAHFSNAKTKSMLVIAPNSGGNAAHPGGTIIANLYVRYNDGRPQECITGSFSTPRENN